MATCTVSRGYRRPITAVVSVHIPDIYATKYYYYYCYYKIQPSVKTVFTITVRCTLRRRWNRCSNVNVSAVPLSLSLSLSPRVVILSGRGPHGVEDSRLINLLPSAHHTRRDRRLAAPLARDRLRFLRRWHRVQQTRREDEKEKRNARLDVVLN